LDNNINVTREGYDSATNNLIRRLRFKNHNDFGEYIILYEDLDEDDIESFVGWIIHTPNSRPYNIQLFVAPRYRKLGYGKKLINLLKKDIKTELIGCAWNNISEKFFDHTRIKRVST
jgi:GNAT superfamily N-acetyltransferase